MSVDDAALAPVRRLEPDRLVALVNAHTDARLTLVGPAPGGQVGAAYVRWSDGREGVLTWLPDGPVGQVRRTAEILALARERGLPVPVYDLIAEVPGALAIVQERLPGAPPSHPDRALVEQLVELVEGFAGLLADRPDVERPDMWLRGSGPGFCLHRPLELHNVRTRRLLEWVRTVGASEPTTMTGDDLVHLDYHPGNVLVAGSMPAGGGAITGIVDWDGIGRGDRRFCLVTLRFAMMSDPTLGRWLDGLLDDLLDPATLRLYWAHMSLRQVDWAIRHFSPGDVEDWLDLAETRMDS
ncbi:aminoglycoside phosphotransferase family protein [Actinopolymorpha sp. B9G3]|uniref:phosphotransferase family protein n=1 Tax=Actinopolymorpha sp. B9G3 TaxID=3158970 RepID=UPI0032D8F2E0